MIKVNGDVVKITKFPNGESLIKSDFVARNGENYVVSMKFESDEDLAHLMMIKNHMDEVNASCILQLPYVPYSRMDRTEGVNVSTLKAMCKFINGLNFKEVHVLEPHSDVCVALLDRSIQYDFTVKQLLPLAIEELGLDLNGSDYLVFPDGGAEKRYAKQVDVKNILTAIKHRDFETGEIKSLEVFGAPTEKFNAVIVDDLCSRGGTFMLTAEKLKELGADKIYLIVTHCENTIFGGEVLKEDSPIEIVFTTNSILNEKVLTIEGEEFKKYFGDEVQVSKLRIAEVV